MKTTSDSPLTDAMLRAAVAACRPLPIVRASPCVPRGTGYEFAGLDGHVIWLVNPEDAAEHGWQVDSGDLAAGFSIKPTFSFET